MLTPMLSASVVEGLVGSSLHVMIMQNTMSQSFANVHWAKLDWEDFFPQYDGACFGEIFHQRTFPTIRQQHKAWN